MSIPSLLCLCSQPTLSVMPTLLYLLNLAGLFSYSLPKPATVHTQSPLPPIVFYAYAVPYVYGQNHIVFYALLLCLPIPYLPSLVCLL